MEAFRRLAPRGNPLARACVGTIRLRLLEIGAVFVRNTRRIRFLFSSHYPEQRLFRMVVARLVPG